MNSQSKNIRQSIAYRLFGGVIHDEVRRAVLAVVDDPFAYGGTTFKAPERGDLDWSDRLTNLNSALEAWYHNPYARRIVNLATSHIVGRNMQIGNGYPDVNQFVQRWWSHPKNQFHLEIYNMVDELTRSGEWFFLLFTNPEDGMQYVRAIPARWVIQIQTDKQDYRKILEYTIVTDEDKPEGTSYPPADRAEPTQPAVLHYAINRPVGAVRSWGGDLDTSLPQIRRYSEWLKARALVAHNANAWAWSMQAADKDRVTELEQKYRGGVEPGSLFIHTPDEKLEGVTPYMAAQDARADGDVLRQAIAAGSNTPPYMLADTISTTRATAREASLPTFKFWEVRQIIIVTFLKDLAQTCVRRAYETRKWHREKRQKLPKEGEWNWTHQVTDLTRDDNQALAIAAKTIVNALAVMKRHKWIDDETAIAWAARFAGESLNPKLILERLEHPPGTQTTQQDEQEAVLAGQHWLIGR